MRHRPTGSVFEFGGARTKRHEIVQMRAVPLVCRRVKLEVNLIKAADEEDCQPLAIAFLSQSADEA